MKKVMFEFSVEDSFDEAEVRRVIHATDAYHVIHNLVEHLRSLVKWSDSNDEAAFAEKLLEYLYDQMEEKGITLDKEFF